jgi:hypothetical protein
VSRFQVGERVRFTADRTDGPSGVVEVLELGDCVEDGECGGNGHDREFLRINNDWVGGDDWMHAFNFERVTA